MDLLLPQTPLQIFLKYFENVLKKKNLKNIINTKAGRTTQPKI